MQYKMQKSEKKRLAKAGDEQRRWKKFEKRRGTKELKKSINIIYK